MAPCTIDPGSAQVAVHHANWHMEEMVRSLGQVTTLVTVGWRAREQHFLKILQEHLPSAPGKLVAVAESDESAQETIDNLWPTGRFDHFAISGRGFSDFTQTPTEPFERPGLPYGNSRLALDHVLSAGPESPVWTGREPGPGLTDTGDEPPYLDPGFVEL